MKPGWNAQAPYGRLAKSRSSRDAGRVIALASQPLDGIATSDCIQVDDAGPAGDAGLCFPYMACGQLYAFHRSLFLGNSPDQPSRSGTVSRVVRGVTIHSL